MKANDLSKLRSLIPKSEVDNSVAFTSLADPSPLLEFIAQSLDRRVTLDDFKILQPWVLAALAALGRRTEGERVYIETLHQSDSAKFAYSLGLDDIIDGEKAHGPAQEGRTVKLCTVATYEEIEPVSDKIASMIISDVNDAPADDYIDAEEVWKTIRYVMIELLRNVIQHSYDRPGGIILAQRMDKGIIYPEPVIQVAVTDCGIGILESLRATHPDIASAGVALERSIWPYYSGKFHSFEAGAPQNAGMGLFFVSEMAKLTSGRVLLSSRGASLFIQGDPAALGNNKIDILPVGYPGTLVAFEMPKRGVSDYDQLIKRIVEIARERRTKAETHHWLRYDIAPQGTLEFLINIASENTVRAEAFAKSELIPRIESGQAIVLNFINMKICTQSFMHALLFSVVKRAFELKVPVYVKGTSESVRDGIRLVEMYTL